MVRTRFVVKSVMIVLVASLAAVSAPAASVVGAQATATTPLVILKHGDIWIWNVDTEQLHQLTEYGDVGQPVLSPDGKRLAFLRPPLGFDDLSWSQDLWVLTLTTGRETQLTKQDWTPQNMDCEAECPIPDKQTISDVVWSPDGRSLFWNSLIIKQRKTATDILESWAGTLWMLDVATGKQRQITTVLKEYASRYGLAVSPTGNKLAWIKIIPPVRKPSSELEDQPVGESTDAEFHFQLIIHDLATGHQILTEIPLSYFDMGQWAKIYTLWEADGIGLSYSGPPNDSPVFIYDDQGKRLYPFVDSPQATSQNPENAHYPGALHWFSYGSQAHFVAGTTLIDLSQHKVLELDGNVAIEGYSHDAPDGYAVNILSRSIIDGSGQEVYKLPDGAVLNSSADYRRWAIDPTGQYIAFTGKNGSINIWSAKTQNVTVIDPFGTAENAPPTSLDQDGALLWSRIDQRLRPANK